MRIAYLPSSVAPAEPATWLTTYIVNETTAVDAGCLGLWGAPDAQAAITDVVLTHSHLDHVASLPIFLDNVYRRRQAGVRVYGAAAVLESLAKNYLTDATWMPLDRMLALDPPMIELVRIEPGRAFSVGGLEILPVEVSHTVPTVGLVLQDDSGSVAITSDTGPTEEFWRAVAGRRDLLAVFIETSFPDAMAALARRSGHLTPALAAEELKKLRREVRTIAMHVKPGYYERVAEDIRSLELPQLEAAEPGRRYDFA